MRPQFDDYLKGSTTWRGEHRQMTYTLCHWGISDYSPEGVWNYYLWLPENMFINPEDFALFNCELKITDTLGLGKMREDYDYFSTPDLDYHGGITFYEKHQTIDPATGKPMVVIKTGCDYNHLWDHEGGFSHGIEEVRRDAINSINILADRYPLKLRCGYTGKIDMPDQFYQAVNGSMVHVDQLVKMKATPEPWNVYWLPAEAVS